jgi:uncharacterized protein (DUF2147 family)
MRTLAIAAVAVMTLASPSFAADPAEGTWKTQVDDGAYAHVKIAACGAALCGTIARTFNGSGEYNSENKGKPIVWDMQAAGGTKYNKGKIWQPSTGKIFNSKMTLGGNTLNVSGCVGPICKKQTWTRVN